MLVKKKNVIIQEARHSAQEATKPHAIPNWRGYFLSWSCQHMFGAKHHNPNLLLKKSLGRPTWTWGTRRSRKTTWN